MEVLPSHRHFPLHGSASAAVPMKNGGDSSAGSSAISVGKHMCDMQKKPADALTLAPAAPMMRCMICALRFAGANELYSHMHAAHQNELVRAHAPASPESSGDGTTSCSSSSDTDDTDCGEEEHLLDDDNDASTSMDLDADEGEDEEFLDSIRGDSSEGMLHSDDDEHSAPTDGGEYCDDRHSMYEYDVDLMEPICELVHSDDEAGEHSATLQSYIGQQTAEQLLQSMQIKWQLDEKTRELFRLQQTHISQMATLNANRTPGVRNAPHEPSSPIVPVGAGAFACSQCEQAFSEADDLVQHQLAHALSKPFQCTICEKTFTHIGSLSTHLRIHSGEKPYKCKKCPKAFTQSSSLMVHLRSHATRKPLQCSVCDKGFVSASSMQSHMRQHEQGDPFQCTECGIGFRLAHLLEEHMAVHRNVNMFQCSLCRLSYAQAGELVQHMKEHTGSRPFRCTQCNKSFSQLGSLNAHLRLHAEGAHPDSKPPANRPDRALGVSVTQRLANAGQVRGGEATTPDQASAKNGAGKRTPLSNKNWQCPVCLKMYSSSAYLAKHVESHGEVISRADLRTQKYLRLQRQQERKPANPCPICHRFIEGGSVAVLLHIGQEHGSRKSMRCWECQADFSDSAAFMGHLREHTERQARQC